MDILGIDIAKLKFDVHLSAGQHQRYAIFPNSEAGFSQLLAWLDKHRADPAAGLHACMEATGNYGIDLAAFLHQRSIRVSIVNPARIKAFAGSELARNKTDRLDAALIARFARAHGPAAWIPPAPQLRELRELVRRCEALKVARTQEINRQKAGFASEAVARSIEQSIAHLDEQIAAMTEAVRALIAKDQQLQRNALLLRSIIGIGEVVCAVILAEIPNLIDFTPKALAAFAGLSPAEHQSGSSVTARRGISRIGSARLRSALYLAALSAKQHNPRLADFVTRMRAAGKPPKVILIAIARRLLVYAHAVIHQQAPFDPAHEPAGVQA